MLEHKIGMLILYYNFKLNKSIVQRQKKKDFSYLLRKSK